MTQLLVRRGGSLKDNNQILEQDIHRFERYGDIMGEEAFERSIEDLRWPEAGRRLFELTLHGQVQWFLHALMPNLSTGLTTVTLGQDVDLDLSPDIFTNLARTSPLLQALEVQCIITSSEDPEAAFRVWGPTLRVRNVTNLEEGSNWIARTMPIMEVLEEPSLGSGCPTSLRDMNAIARSRPPRRLSHLSLGELQVPDQGDETDKAPDELNDSLIRLTESHSSTLRRISLNNDYLKVGRAVLHCLKKATRLEALFVGAPADAQSLDIDHLLEACPALESLGPSLQKLSARRDEWAGRIEAMDERHEREVERDQSIWGLGS
ncbi:hypothetical protein QQZ08_001803 [Neonectria magnoliae]|uniref:Uncharacterized protein n=1 Tax=Neonectria magnoliae TaxID=2732573 RepID=A0ABR1IEU6_9HYPO